MIVMCRKKGLQPMIMWYEGLDMERVSISEYDKENGSPKEGDMIAWNPKDQGDQWLISKEFFEEVYEVV